MLTLRVGDATHGRELLTALVRELGGPDATVTRLCPTCGGSDHGAPIVILDGDAAAGAAPGMRPLWASLTRAGATAVAALSDVGPVGVDAELVAAGDDRVRAIAALTGEWSLEHWTRVEAVLKADGRGLAVDPSFVRVDPDGASATLADSGARYALAAHAVDPAVMVTTAVREI